jgi:DNA-binding GntR family transcriptional regulator
MELARDLAVSRPTIRMALVRLEREGLVVTQPNRGASVRAIGLREAIQMLRVQEVLDGLVAALAAESATPEELDAMADVVAQMERLTASYQDREYAALDARLHALILQAAHDDLLERQLASLNYVLVRYQYRIVLVDGWRQRSLAEHRAILQAIIRGDAAGAEQAMRQHVSHVRATLMQGVGAAGDGALAHAGQHGAAR